MGNIKDMKESKIEEILREEVKKLGGRAYKFVSPGNDGVPDRIVIFPCRQPIFVELKTSTEKLTRLQRVQLKRLQDLGQDTYVIRGLDGLSQFFQDWGYEDVSKALDCKFEL